MGPRTAARRARSARRSDSDRNVERSQVRTSPTAISCARKLIQGGEFSIKNACELSRYCNLPNKIARHFTQDSTADCLLDVSEHILGFVCSGFSGSCLLLSGG